MYRGRHTAGDVLVGNQQADGSKGTEKTDGKQRKPGTFRYAEGLVHEYAHGQQDESGHTPAVGEHLERREARVHEGDGKKGNEAECQGRDCSEDDAAGLIFHLPFQLIRNR